MTHIDNNEINDEGAKTLAKAMDTMSELNRVTLGEPLLLVSCSILIVTLAIKCHDKCLNLNIYFI